MRLTLNGVDHEVSPFRNIPSSMYWVIITLTTGMRLDMLAANIFQVCCRV